jgi:hypothetical protein
MSFNFPAYPTIQQKQRAKLSVIYNEEQMFVQFQWTALSNIANKNREC